MQIADLLSHGQENAVPLSHIKSMTGMKGRNIRRMIAAERLSGIPILSDCSTGYYLAENAGEKERFVRSMRHRAREIERAAEAIERAEG